MAGLLRALRGEQVSEFSACVVLVGGRDVDNTVWNHVWQTDKASIIADIFLGKETHKLDLVKEALM